MSNDWSNFTHAELAEILNNQDICELRPGFVFNFGRQEAYEEIERLREDLKTAQSKAEAYKLNWWGAESTVKAREATIKQLQEQLASNIVGRNLP